MSKFYAVELAVIAIVQVNDDQDGFDAEAVADKVRSDIFRDCGEPVTLAVDRIRSLKDLQPLGWDGECLPYGGDGNTRLRELLPAEPPKPEPENGNG